MKIGLYTHNFPVMNCYWEQLKKKTDCWWGVPEKKLFELLKLKKIKKVVFSEEKYFKDKNKKKGNQFVTKNNIKAQKEIIKKINPDLWIVDTPNKLTILKKGTPVIQTLHSLPIKKHVFYKPYLNSNLILLPGKYHYNEFRKRFGKDLKKTTLKIVGWPRLDGLIKNKYNRKKILKKFGLDEKKKTVTYAPTWGWGEGNSSLFCRWHKKELEVFERICALIYQLNLNFIIRLHSLSFLTKNKKMIKIANKYGVHWQTKETSNYQDDPNETLWVTDILISDLSGIISEYLILDRPIIYIDPIKNSKAWKESDMPKNFRVGHIVKSFKEFKHAIQDSIFFPNRFKRQRNILKKKLFSRLNGSAGKFAANVILKFANTKLRYN